MFKMFAEGSLFILGVFCSISFANAAGLSPLLPKLPDLPKEKGILPTLYDLQVDKGLLPKIPDLREETIFKDTLEKTKLIPEVEDVFEKFKNTTGKIKLEDFPQNTDLDELLKEIIYKGLIEYEEHNTKFPLLDFAVEQLKIPSKLFSKNPVTSTIININVCNACAAVMKYLVIRTRAQASQERLADVLTFVCTLFRISSERVCRGAIELNLDIITYIIKEKPTLNELKICSTVFQSFSCFKDVRTKWEVFIPNGFSPVTKINDANNKNFRILHITDFHVDSLYKEGANADCGEPLCCQNDQGSPSHSENAAGKWGDYRECDMPYYSLTNYLEQISNQIKEPGNEIDFVYFTGDVISHRVWDTSRESNTQELQKTYNLLKQYFGSIPVYSIIGNHEPHPLNVFSPPEITNEFSNRWIYDVIGKEWSKWLPNSTYETVHYGGYYSTLVRPRLRIIALNSNICYTYNWWLLYDDIDPFHQLRWLAITLKESESKNEFVHILSHVPPGDNTCIQEWTRQFRRIIERFSHIIKGQFNGHTHFDELRVFYNSSNSNQVINVAYNGGSFTTFSDLNPNYRYYNISSETYEVLDYDQWIYNLEDANTKPNEPPKWYKHYSFKEAYGLNSLKYEEVDKLINKMSEDESLLQKYYRFKVRDAAPSLLTGCKNSCHKQNLCDIVTTEVDDDSKCRTLTQHHKSLPFLQ